MRDGEAGRVEGRRGHGTHRRPDWLRDFRSWTAGLSPSALADLLDELAGEVSTRNLADTRALAEAADRVRSHQAARVRQCVDEFLISPEAAFADPAPRRHGARRATMGLAPDPSVPTAGGAHQP